MKVLLTGSTGFIGRHVTKELQLHGIDFVTVGRSGGPNCCEHFCVDLLTMQDFMGIISESKPTHLIHLAWYAEHGKYWDSPLNLDWMSATYRLVESFCKQGGEHVVIAGTCAEYDWRFGYCDEDLTPANPKTLYGIAKDAVRRMCQMLCYSHSVRLAWTRIFYPYGSDEAPGRLIPSLFKAFRNEVAPFGVNGTHFRDLMHVSDLAAAVCTCLSDEANGIINLSSGEPTALREIVTKIAAFSGHSPSLILNQPSLRTGEPTLLVGNNSRLKSLGWQQKVDLQSGLSNYFKYYR